MATTTTTNYAKSFSKPDETRSFKGHGHLDVLQFENSTIGKATFEPGWKWSQDIKPMAGTASCQVVHTGYCISGQMVVRMDNGDEFTIHAGDAFHLPAGHDAWTVGKETCVMLDVAPGTTGYAKPR